MVIAIGGILVATVISRASNVRQTVGLESATQKLAAELRRAQVEAIRRNRTVAFTRIDSSTYQIDFVGRRSLGAGITFDAAVPSRVEFASFGPPPTGSASFAIKAGARRKDMKLEASGFLRITPSRAAATTTTTTTTLGGQQ